MDKKAARRKIPGNPYLYIGILLLTLLFAICISPQSFTNTNPYGIERYQFVFLEGKLNLFAPPYGPNGNWPWGTDILGRDIRSLIIYGASMTIFTAVIIAMLRTGIALVVSLFAAYGFKLAKDSIRVFSSLFSAVPLTVVVILLIKLGYSIGPKSTDGGYAVGLTVILAGGFLGWGRLSGLLTEKISEIMQMDFIEGERAIGKGKFRIAIENLIPHLLPQLVVLAFLEVSGVLLLLCQIGFFGVLLNGGFSNNNGDFVPPAGMDWASLLSICPVVILATAYWLVLFPALAFAYSIFAFNLMGEGMRIELERNGSKIIGRIRNAPALFSLPRFVYEIRNFHQYKSMVIKKIAVLSIVILIILWPASQGNLTVNDSEINGNIAWLTGDDLKGRMTGQEKSLEIAEKFSADMKKHGVIPFAAGFIQEYTVNPYVGTENAEITAESSLTKPLSLAHRKDFQVTLPVTMKGSFEVVNYTRESLFEVNTRRDIDANLKDKFILIDLRNLPEWTYENVLDDYSKDLNPKGILYITNDPVLKLREKKYSDRRGGYESRIPNIRLTAEAGDRLRRLNKFTIDIDMKSIKAEESEGYNIIGKIPGKGKGIVIIGASYDGPGFDEKEKYSASSKAASVAILMNMYEELSKKQEQLDKTVIFALWDGSCSINRGSDEFLSQFGVMEKRLKLPEPLTEDGVSNSKESEAGDLLYIDLGPIGRGVENTIIMDTRGCLPRDKFATGFIKQIRGSKLKNRPKIIENKVGTREQFDFLEKNVNTIAFSQTDKEVSKTEDDTVSKLNTKSIKNFGSFLMNEIYYFVKDERGEK